MSILIAHVNYQFQSSLDMIINYVNIHRIHNISILLYKKNAFFMNEQAQDEKDEQNLDLKENTE